MKSNRCNNESTSTHQNDTTKSLTCVASRCILLKVNTIQERVQDNDCYGRAAYTRGYRKIFEDIRIQGQSNASKRNYRRDQSRWTMESQASRLQTVSRLSEPEEKQQLKNKASSIGWPATVKKIIAVARSPLRAWKPMRDGPSESLPFLVYTYFCHMARPLAISCVSIFGYV